jgi:hypothetical protein
MLRMTGRQRLWLALCWVRRSFRGDKAGSRYKVRGSREKIWYDGWGMAATLRLVWSLNVYGMRGSFWLGRGDQRKTWS